MGEMPLTLVSCVGMKATASMPARDLYVSPWFVLARRFAEKRGGAWLILSAEYGLVEPERIVAPYNRTLNSMPAAERRLWAQHVADDLQAREGWWESIVVLAGLRYREFLLEHLERMSNRVEVPMLGLRIGQQLQWLKRSVSA